MFIIRRGASHVLIVDMANAGDKMIPDENGWLPISEHSKNPKEDILTYPYYVITWWDNELNAYVEWCDRFEADQPLHPQPKYFQLLPKPPIMELMEK